VELGLRGLNLYRDQGRVMPRSSISSRGKRALSRWRRHVEEGDMGQKTSPVDGRGKCEPETVQVRGARGDGTVNP
jgi:hypothetical protein